MKKIISMLMAVFLMASLTVSAFAADTPSDFVSFNFWDKQLITAELPFYEYNEQTNKAAPVNKAVSVVHMNSTDNFTITNTTTNCNLMIVGTILSNSDGLGYTATIGSGVFSYITPGDFASMTPIDRTRLFDPAFSTVEYSKDAPLVIRLNVECTPNDFSSDAVNKQIYIVLDDTATDISYACKFNDINQENYFYDPVIWAVANGITVGTTENTFSPYKTCTNAQIITFMWRKVGSPIFDSKCVNPAIDPSSYYYNAVAWACAEGIIDESFDPNAPCTRAMTVDYFWKLNDKPETNLENPFTDVSVDAEYATAVSWALENGITSGTSDTTFSPDSTCTRAQIVTFLHRMG